MDLEGVKVYIVNNYDQNHSFYFANYVFEDEKEEIEYINQNVIFDDVSDWLGYLQNRDIKVFQFRLFWHIASYQNDFHTSNKHLSNGYLKRFFEDNILINIQPWYKYEKRIENIAFNKMYRSQQHVYIFWYDWHDGNSEKLKDLIFYKPEEPENENETEQERTTKRMLDYLDYKINGRKNLKKILNDEIKKKNFLEDYNVSYNQTVINIMDKDLHND